MIFDPRSSIVKNVFKSVFACRLSGVLTDSKKYDSFDWHVPTNTYIVSITDGGSKYTCTVKPV